MIKSFDQLINRVEGRHKNGFKPRVGVIYPDYIKPIEAAIRAAEKGYIIPYFIGSKKYKSVSKYEYVPAASLDEAIRIGVEGCRNGRLDYLMKASLSSRDFVDGIMTKNDDFAKNSQTITHFGIVEIEGYHKLMIIADGMVNTVVEPDTMIRMIKNAGVFSSLLGNDNLKAALLAAVEKVYQAVSVTVMEADIVRMFQSKHIGIFEVDGPLSLDVAINKNVAHSKGITDSIVAGDADIFICPSIATANGLYKAMTLFGEIRSAGIIIGGRSLIAAPYASDSVESMINAIIICNYIYMNVT
jgi:phosphate butyryltransferase